MPCQHVILPGHDMRGRRALLLHPNPVPFLLIHAPYSRFLCQSAVSGCVKDLAWFPASYPPASPDCLFGSKLSGRYVILQYGVTLVSAVLRSSMTNGLRRPEVQSEDILVTHFPQMDSPRFFCPDKNTLALTPASAMSKLSQSLKALINSPKAGRVRCLPRVPFNRFIAVSSRKRRPSVCRSLRGLLYRYTPLIYICIILEPSGAS